MGKEYFRRPIQTGKGLTCGTGVTVSAGHVTVTAGNAVLTAGGVDHTITATTAAGALVTYGINTIVGTTGAPNYTLAAPTVGRGVRIFCIDGTTAKTCTVTLAASVSLYSSATTAATLRKITFNAANEGVVLQGLSATKYFVENTIGSPTLGTT